MIWTLLASEFTPHHPLFPALTSIQTQWLHFKRFILFGKVLKHLNFPLNICCCYFSCYYYLKFRGLFLFLQSLIKLGQLLGLLNPYWLSLEYTTTFQYVDPHFLDFRKALLSYLLGYFLHDFFLFFNDTNC